MRLLLPVLLTSMLMACGQGKQADLAAEQKILAGYPEASTELSLKQVSEHVYYAEGVPGVATDNQGFISNAAVIITDEGVVVFDALGTPALASKMVRQLREITRLPIVKVVVSHYHADHIYGLQVYKELGAEIIAPAGAEEYIGSSTARERLEERRFSLDPWVNEKTYVVNPDRYVSTNEDFSLGGIDFKIDLLGGAHSDGDMTLYVVQDRVLLSGDIIFEGRVAYLGDADTKRWLETLEKMETTGLVALIPGHGPAAKDPTAAIRQTRAYLAFIRTVMAEAVDNLMPFDQAYAEADWSEFENLPAFDLANRRNAYQVYLSIEAEGFQ